MKKIILFLVIVLAAAWALQDYTSFKALDYAKVYWQKIDQTYLKNIDWSKFNLLSEKTPDPEKQLNIFIRDGKFVPNSNAAAKGIKVTWYNEDTKPHTVTGENWGSQQLSPGAKYSKTFDVEGTYKYACSLHPSMTGEIVIK